MRSTRAFGLLAAAGIGLALAACGELSGLADDYSYDLDADGGPSLASADATADASSAADASRDAEADSAAATKCQAQSVAATTLLGTNGSAECRSCLASQCCTEVIACYGAGNQSCRSHYQCMLKCTEKAGADRTACFGSCDTLKSDAVSKAADTCIDAACTKFCGF